MIERRGTPTWVRALLVLALLAGLVAMHQMATPTLHHADATSVVAAHAPDHHPAPAGGHTSVLEHLCLAVLVALATLAAAVVGLVGAPTRRPGTARGPTPVLAGPAPVPVPRRLAALQVLRL